MLKQRSIEEKKVYGVETLTEGNGKVSRELETCCLREVVMDNGEPYEGNGYTNWKR